MTENQEEAQEKKTGPIGERLLKIIQHYHLNMNSLSTRLGLPSNSVITRIVKDPGRGIRNLGSLIFFYIVLLLYCGQVKY